MEFIYLMPWNFIYIYGEKVDIFGRSDKMMKDIWKSGYTKKHKQLIQFRIFRSLFTELKKFFSTNKEQNILN